MGTTNLSLSREDFLSFAFSVPPKDALVPLAEILSALTRRIEDLDETRSLAAVRDALLPRLLSGELEVRAAERFVEATA